MYFPKGEKLVFSTLRDHYDLNPNRYYHIDRLDLHGYGNVIARYTDNLSSDLVITANFVDETKVRVTYMVDDEYYSSFDLVANKKISNYDRYPLRTPIKAGYRFLGWKTSDSEPFDEDTIVTKDITVYADWEDENIMTVTFMNEDATHATLKIMKNTCISDHPDLSLPSNPARDLYNFLGWETSSHDTFDENYVVTESMTIYPKWDYTLAKITFETHDGTYTTVDITKNTSINDNPEVQFPDNPTRENYKFLGWETANHDAFNEYSIAATSMTVYARWEYMLATVTFKNYETTITTFNITKYTSISEHPDLSLPEDPVRDGHKFLGWKTEDDEVFDANYKVNKSIIVSAAWGDMTPVTITFMTEGGEHATRTIPGYTSINENSQNGIEMPSNPYKADHYFRCWRTVDDVRFTKDTIVTESITVNAYWSGEYNVKLSFLIDNFLHYWIDMQNDARITDYGNLSLPSAPDREFEKFVGWKTPDGNPFDDYTIVTASTRIYAQYEPKEVATISFNTGITGFEINDMLVVKNIALGDKTPRLISRQNHMFLGWFTAGNVPVNEDYVVTEDITIYAKWKEAATFTLTVKLGDGYGSVPIYFPVNSRVYFNRLEKYYELNPNLYYKFNSYTCKNTSGLYNHYFTIDEDLEAIADWTDKTPDPVTITFMFYEDYYAKITLPRNTSVSDNWWNYWPFNPYQQYHEYRGWKTSSGDSFDKNTTVTEDITVYADMEQTSFPITYMNQGEVYCIDYMGKGACYYDWHYGEHFPDDPPAPPYHQFLGWYTEDGDRFNLSTRVYGPVTVYARWQDNTPAFVTFIDRGTQHDLLEVPKGTAIKNNPGMTLPETPSRDGYRFLGWFTADNVPFDTHYVVMESMTLYASWGDMTPVTITFMTENGEHATVTIPGYTSINENSGAGIDMPSNPSKDGHYFRCWRTVDDVMFTKDTRVTGPMVVNARWSGTNIVSISYVMNGISLGWFEIYGNSRITDYSDRSLPTESALYARQRRGEFYQHTGWVLEDGTPFDEYSVVNVSITIFAKYEPLETATISFVTNRDGFVVNDLTVVKNRALGTKKVRPLTKENHKFLGWFTIDDVEVNENYVITGNITVYAKWETKATWPFTVVLGDGYDPIVMYFPKDERLYLNTLVDYYELNPMLHRSFSNYKIGSYNLYNHWIMIDREFTATATWKYITPVTVTYMVEDEHYSSFTLEINKKISNYDRYYVRNPKKSGYTFKGWKTSSGDPFDENTVVTADITVYADWEPETP
ncbi:MAG TPA: InlB B-repeat-containing protein [Acholeplasmataceae bacterium]|nr:InlB B-repeat-containing protein [Acholeplasmataceae bacterium]